MNCLAFVLTALVALDPQALQPATAITAESGDGGMTVGLDATGALKVLRWPGPGGPNQIRQSVPAGNDGPKASDNGGRWGVEVAGHWYWFGDAAARTQQRYFSQGSPWIETIAEWPEAGITIRQRAGVALGQGIFVSTIEISGVRSAPRAVWVADFAATTWQIPELPLGTGARGSSNGFATFADPNARRMWCFRPQNPGRAEWARARDLVTAGVAPEAWDEFQDGTWIGVATSEASSNLLVAPSMPELVAAIESGATTPTALVGPSAIGVEAAMESAHDGYRAWIAVSAGLNRAAGAHALTDAATVATAALDATPPPQGTPSNVLSPDPGILQRVIQYQSTTYAKQRVIHHQTVLHTLRDPQSGFTVRRLSADPPLARDWPRDGAIAAWAFFEAGDHEAAEKSIEAYLSLIRTEEKPRRPFGSMPESVYTNGELASPHFVIDDRGPARVLWVADRMSESRGPKARAAWVQSHWKPIEAAGEFLSTWADARRGAPLYSDDPMGLADAETQDRLLADFAGMSAAIRLAETAGREVPEAWRVRRDQLLALTEWVLEEPAKWLPGESVLLETNGVSESALDALAKNCLRETSASVTLSTAKEARLLLQLAVLKRDGHGIEDVALESALGRINADESRIYPPPDSLESAEILLALLLRVPK